MNIDVPILYPTLSHFHKEEKSITILGIMDKLMSSKDLIDTESYEYITKYEVLKEVMREQNNIGSEELLEMVIFKYEDTDKYLEVFFAGDSKNIGNVSKKLATLGMKPDTLLVALLVFHPTDTP